MENPLTSTAAAFKGPQVKSPGLENDDYNRTENPIREWVMARSPAKGWVRLRMESRRAHDDALATFIFRPGLELEHSGFLIEADA